MSRTTLEGPVEDGAAAPPLGTISRPSATGEPGLASFVSASTDLLFEPDVPRCDVCDGIAELDENGQPAAGRALYLWTRGKEVRREEPPLCVGCATALGVTALAQWDAQEDEG